MDKVAHELTFIGDVLRLLDDDEFRRDAARRVENPQVRRFWLREYGRYSPGRRAEAIGPVQNKVGAFLAHPKLQAADCCWCSTRTLYKL